MILKGKKTILRPIKMSDAQRFVDWLKDPEVNKFTTRKAVTIKEEREWIKKLPARVKKGEFQFAIDTIDGTHIGSVGLSIYKMDNNAEFGILIGDKEYWDKGYGSDVMQTLFKFGFNKLRIHKIFLDGGGVYSYNPRAIRAYEKAGFKHEGIKKDAILYKGKYHSTIMMGLLAKEWKKKK